eukprot:942478-Amphidinium_carterae.1
MTLRLFPLSFASFAQTTRKNGMGYDPKEPAHQNGATERTEGALQGLGQGHIVVGQNPAWKQCWA